MSKSTSLWFPNLQSWLSAVVLAFTSGLLIAGIYNIAALSRIFDLIPPRGDLFVGMLATLSPIFMIAFGHHWLYLVMDRFFPDSSLADVEAVKGYWPTLSSWWEGLYGWLTLVLATILCVGIGGLLLPSRYGAGGGEIYWILAEPNKFKYLFSPPFVVWILSAAYLYQFEHVMRLHFSSLSARAR
jgi:hypothetical protein